MGWAIGLMIVCGSLIAVYLCGAVMDRFGPLDDVDHVAQQKRLTGKRARKMAHEFQERR